MTAASTKRLRLGIIAAMTAATVSFHYGILMPSAHGTVLHAIHGRLCYVPIILAAIWFGVRGGLLTALAITALTLPYPKLRGITDHHTLVGEYTEMVFYLGIGLDDRGVDRTTVARARSECCSRTRARAQRALVVAGTDGGGAGARDQESAGVDPGCGRDSGRRRARGIQRARLVRRAAQGVAAFECRGRRLPGVRATATAAVCTARHRGCH